MSEPLSSIRKGPPRISRMLPTKKYWSDESKTIARAMKAAGASTAEISERVGKSQHAIRAFFNQGKPYPSRTVPLAELERGLTSMRCRKCETEKPLADFAVNKIKGTERRWPYCKPCEIARLADRREKGLHLEKTRRHIAKHKVKYPEQALANKIFSTAIRSGKIIRPETCEVCGNAPPRNRLGRSAIQGHHDDYSKPLEVRWFCHPCHIQHHRNLKNGQ